MAKITIGGKEYSVPEMNFVAIERAWPLIQAATMEFDPIRGTSGAISVIAAAMMEAETFNLEDWDMLSGEALDDDEIFKRLTNTIKRRLKATEIPAVKTTMFTILEEAGLELSEGELLTSLGINEPAATPSLETAPDTSQSSSPQELKEVAGTA